MRNPCLDAMEDKADRAGTEMETLNAQNRPLANERSQHYEVPSDPQTTARLGAMSEAGGNGDNASEAPPESAKIFTMLGNPPPVHDSSKVPGVNGYKKTTQRS